MTTQAFDLDSLISLRNLSLDEVKERFNMSEDDIEHGLKYGKLSGLTKLYNPQTNPGHFYFKGGKLVMLYVGKTGELSGASPEALRRELGEPAAELRSRVGKTFNHYVYPKKGVAFSTDGDEVRVLEIFPPTTLEKYSSEIYDDPGPFVK